MIPICFFPFTRMTPAQARAMDAFFDGFKMLALDRTEMSRSHYSDLEGAGRLEPVYPPEEKMAALEPQVRAFRDWAALHRGNEKNLKALIREKTWFQDDNGVAAIQSQIRSRNLGDNRGGGTAPAGEAPQGDPLLMLKFAEILDRENETIRQSLNAIEGNNVALFAELKGELAELDGDAGPLALPEGSDDPAADLAPGQIDDRIRAWSSICKEAGCFDSQGGPVVLATTSSAVAGYLTANFEGAINGLDIDSIKVHEDGCAQRKPWQRSVEQALSEIASGQNTALPRKDADPCTDPCGCPAGGIGAWFFSGGQLNKEFNIPGTQVVVCLVKLNS